LKQNKRENYANLSINYENLEKKKPQKNINFKKKLEKNKAKARPNCLTHFLRALTSLRDWALDFLCL
jgi:hypothetical protein